MAELIDLVCDQCGTTDRVPAYGWVALRPARRSEIVAEPPPRGDFCSIACLTAYVARMSIQASLDDAVRDASEGLEA